MKDHFSVQLVDYSKFRPNYPEAMLQEILSLVNNKEMALDVATGNGQVAVELAPYFQKVCATDISDKQLSQAIVVPNVSYKKMTAEHTDFDNEQFDLITVAQAIHWFDFDAFYKEVYRILKPDGIFAVLGYGFFSTNPDSDKILWHLYEDILGTYWNPERQYLTDAYQTIPFPLEELVNKRFSREYTWSFEQLMGYLQTWSATMNFIKENNQNPVGIVKDELRLSWEKGDKRVSFPMFLRMGKKMQ
ncbi:class I SAM-dependent methyltransferase [Flavobacterium pedocola]